MRCKTCDLSYDFGSHIKDDVLALVKYMCGSCKRTHELLPSIQCLHQLAYNYDIETPKWRYWYGDYYV